MSQLSIPEKWDFTTDVLIIGGGTAGMPAAIAVTEAGLKATILELTRVTGGSGSLIMAGGAFAGTELQEAAGIQDSAEQYYRDGIELGKGDADVWRVIADNQLDTYKWLLEIGCEPVRPDLLPAPGHTNPRVHYYVGAPVEARITEVCNQMGIDILYEHRANRLIADPETNRILGARVQTKDGQKYFKASRAVLLATGSFGRNKDMLQEYGSFAVNCLPLMAPGHLGDGLKMALEFGAQTSHIGDSVVTSLAYCTTTKRDRCLWASQHGGGLLINVNGDRFFNESCPGGYYGQSTRAFLDQPGEVAWIVYDQMGRDIVGDHEMGGHKEFKADTLEELAKVAGIENVKNFLDTVKKYNDDIESEGYDTVFGRKFLIGNFGDPRPVDQGPYYAVKAGASITSFKGGLKVNSRGQVINVYGEPIPGLYAAGEINGGLFSRGCYMAGTNWQGSMTTGRVYARNACMEKAWD